MNPKRSNSGFFVILLILVMAAYYFISVFQPGSGDYSYQQLMRDVKANHVTAITIKQNKEVPTGTVTAELGKDNYKSCEVTDVNETIKDIKASNKSLGNKIEIKGIDHSGDMISNLIGVVLPIGVVIFFMVIMMRQNGGGGGKMMDFGKSRAKLANPNAKKVTFNDVAGLTEEKEELEEVVEFLKNPGRFIKIGARIPKGVLLVGPPGTGKTLLAKAVAGEANVPFFSISGSDFVEMFVGVGAARVRDLFAEAKKHSPCIVFIDEIDAVARRRGSGLGGGHDEREQTLNQMLVEMDGFGVNEGIIMIAATNRVDILDPAILRPGRFDRKVGVGRPDVKGREEILKIHCREKPLGDDVDLHEIARTTAGFVGADLENLMNEAAIQAARDDRAYIIKEDIDKSFIKVGIGTEKKSRVVPESERRITAYHESGHAILFHLLPDVGPVYTVSIIPTGTGAAGYTMPLPENDNVFMTKGKLIQDIMVSLGGRIAEELILDDITTGASQDIKQVTQYARAMVTKFGMSDELGLINYDSGEGDEVFLGKEIGQQRPYGEDTQTLIDQEVKKIVNKCYQDAKAMIEEHMDVLHKCAALLLEKERINRVEDVLTLGDVVKVVCLGKDKMGRISFSMKDVK